MSQDSGISVSTAIAQDIDDAENYFYRRWPDVVHVLQMAAICKHCNDFLFYMEDMAQSHPNFLVFPQKVMLSLFKISLEI